MEMPETGGVNSALFPPTYPQTHVLTYFSGVNEILHDHFALMSLPRFAPQKARTGMMGWDDVTPLAGISPPAVQGMPLSASARSLHPLMCSC